MLGRKMSVGLADGSDGGLDRKSEPLPRIRIFRGCARVDLDACVFAADIATRLIVTTLLLVGAAEQTVFQLVIPIQLVKHGLQYIMHRTSSSCEQVPGSALFPVVARHIRRECGRHNHHKVDANSTITVLTAAMMALITHLRAME